MKRSYAPLLAACLFFISCNNNKPKDSVTVTSKDGKEQVTINPDQVQDEAAAMQKKKEELGNLTPLGADELKALIPEQLMGAARTDLDVTAAMGASVASADYIINDSSRLRLSIIDCAGPGGAGIYSTQFLGMFNLQQEDEEEYTKTIDFDGGKAFENCSKTHKECTLTYFGGGRYLVSLEGNNMEIGALKELGMNLKFK